MLIAMMTALGLHAGVNVDYEVVYVRQIRHGDTLNTIWPEVFHPARAEPGADLVLRHPDGSEEVLIDCTDCSVTDPFVSFDGKSVYYSLFYDLRDSELNYQRGDLPYAGADIFRIDLDSRVIEQLTFGEFTPNTGAGHWDESNPVSPSSEFNRLGYGILNLGPSPVPGGKIAFTSNRNGYEPPKSFTNPTLQLFVMDEDGQNVRDIGPMSINSALHPTILNDGRLMFSSYESQGLRDRRLWGIWAIYPDGRQWSPVVSAFKSPSAFHFMTQLTGGDLVVTDYYNLNNNGFGAMYRFPVRPPAGTPGFYGADPSQNPAIEQTVSGGFSYPFRMAFTPWGMHSITPFTHGNDDAAPVGSDGQTRVGKVTHPSAAPNGDLLVVWTPGPANDLNRPETDPRYDAGLYVIEGGQPVLSPDDLVPIVNDPAYNEAWPRAVVSWNAIHGQSEPDQLAWLPNDGTLDDRLPEGTPHGLIGTSSFYKRESFPGRGADEYDGLDVFNTSENGHSSNWGWQGSDAGKYDNSDIWAVRLVALEPNTHRSYGPNSGRHFENFANERHRILGEIPLRKFAANGDPIMDPEGNPDTSFLALIPADTPFTFQTIDRDGAVLNMAQTWHQVRPGEVRVDCGGCHAHSQQPLAFEATAAAAQGFPIYDLSRQTPMITQDGNGDADVRVEASGVVDVEFYRDIRPILQRSCIGCHTANVSPTPGNLVLDDLGLYGGLPGDYKRLADDSGAQFGHPPVITNGIWRQTNASRYVRKFQSRRSLLVWKIFGRRMDGWTNADHPTESVPGDAATLPAGASRNLADLDFTGDIMPPPGSGYPALTTDEKMTFARWIDLGAPINIGEEYGSGHLGWFLDDLRPTLTVSSPRMGFNASEVNAIRLGLADAHSGIDMTTLSLTADFPLAGRDAGAELADLLVEVDTDIFEIRLPQPMAEMAEAHLMSSVRDLQGNIKRLDVKFATAPTGVIFLSGFEVGR